MVPPSGEYLQGERRVWCICRVKAVWSIPERLWGEVLTKRCYTNVQTLPSPLLMQNVRETNETYLLTGFRLWCNGLRRLTWFTKTSTVLGFNTELILLALLKSTCCTSQQSVSKATSTSNHALKITNNTTNFIFSFSFLYILMLPVRQIKMIITALTFGFCSTRISEVILVVW